VATDLFGEEHDVLHVKGSGADMATLRRDGFAPLRLAAVARLAELPALSDARMAIELRAASLDPGSPAPSVESILHAVLPDRFVLHTHADAVLALSNTPAGEDLAAEVWGDRVVVVPYCMPGFALARECAARLAAERHDGTVGMVLMHHGLFTFAATARAAYENHVDLVGQALARAEAAGPAAVATPAPDAADEEAPGAGDPDDGDDADFGAGDREDALPLPGGMPVGDLEAVAELRRAISSAAGRPLVLHTSTSEASRRFARRPDASLLTQVGPATPDHVIRTKRVPLVGRDVAAYMRDYGAYVERHRSRLGHRTLVPVDPAPRVVVDPDLGVLAAGPRAADARAAADIYDHTIWVIERATALGGYRSVSEPDVFDVEYWELEQAKLARQPAPDPLTGRVALVTGAASGIGRACARALLAAGAAVVGLDLDAAVEEVDAGPAFVGVQGDASMAGPLGDCVARAVRAFGGLDVLVLNAGELPAGEPVAALTADTWARALAVNAGGAALALRAAYPFLRRAPGGGSVVVIGSKNVPAPGTGMAAYSASKAALTQLARVAALEWGGDGIRVNVVHPDAVFDTALWTDELIAARAAAYGLTPEAYRRRNLLGAEVTSAHVAQAVVALCGPAFARTTGAQIPVDGGNERVV
jgi:rhamnose utilization protein RhaD (predicted bifunctional aldolase and dehydrogenase)/NAD(P)-dependent dehydrogenase (short-subunit alcohol dehydrogenase family)